MSHKEVWNAIIHSREIWPPGDFLHYLDVMMLAATVFYFFMWYVLFLEWQRGGPPPEDTHSYERWLRLWKNQQRCAWKKRYRK